MSSTTETQKSSRKRKAPIDDNGEPVMVSKKKATVGPHPSKKPKPAPTKKVTPKAATKTAPSKKKTLPVKNSSTNQQVPTRSASVEDMYDEEDHPRPDPPRNPQQILELVDSEGEDNDPPPPAKDVNVDSKETDDGEQEEAEEDDDAELGWFKLPSYSVKIAKF
jgi:hypothetical protein